MGNNIRRFAVLNCFVTQVLGRYETLALAQVAANEFGKCSFAYELSDAELASMDAAVAA